MIGISLDQAAFGLAETSSPRPVSRKDFRLDRTAGQPFFMPLQAGELKALHATLTRLVDGLRDATAED